MRRIKFIITTLILGLFVAFSHGYSSIHEQERQEQERNDQEKQEQEKQEQEKQDIPEGDDRTMEIDGLPQTVRDTLKSEYGDWIPVEASLRSDPEEGPVYRVKLHDADNEEAKIITITRLGEIIDEEEAEIEDESEIFKITHDGEVLDEEDVGTHEHEDERRHDRRY